MITNEKFSLKQDAYNKLICKFLYILLHVLVEYDYVKTCISYIFNDLLFLYTFR